MIQTDFLVIGSGLAGLAFAIKVAEKDPLSTVTIITKAHEEETNTRLAQGGIAAVLNEGADSVENHVNDTLKAGDGLCKKSVVEFVVKEAPDRVRELISWGAEFDKSGGGYHLAKEGGHILPRVLHKGDQTGLEIHKTVLAKICKYPNVRILDSYFAMDLISGIDAAGNCRCYGATALNQVTDQIAEINARVTVLATGGVGQVFKNSTNPNIATGDGIAMVHRAKAVIRNMEFIQYHPTALFSETAGTAFLISEAVRGFGAMLRLKNGETFMENYDSRLSLASRDIVSRAIHTEMSTRREKHVMLDCTMISTPDFVRHFPAIHQKCISLGIDPSCDHIPVIPSAHYLCGGILTNEYGETTIKDLYACGECASTGLHGANRLASNSLLEALVFAHRAAIHSLENLRRDTEMPSISLVVPQVIKTVLSSEEIDNKILKIKLVMNNVGPVNNTAALEQSMSSLRELIGSEKISIGSPAVKEYEFRNLLTTAVLIIEQSLDRKENKGGFFNSDLKLKDHGMINAL